MTNLLNTVRNWVLKKELLPLCSQLNKTVCATHSWRRFLMNASLEASHCVTSPFSFTETLPLFSPVDKAIVVFTLQRKANHCAAHTTYAFTCASYSDTKEVWWQFKNFTDNNLPKKLMFTFLQYCVNYVTFVCRGDHTRCFFFWCRYSDKIWCNVILLL